MPGIAEAGWWELLQERQRQYDAAGEAEEGEDDEVDDDE